MYFQAINSFIEIYKKSGRQEMIPVQTSFGPIINTFYENTNDISEIPRYLLEF